MKKGIAYFILLGTILVFGCKKDEPELFNQPDGIYFGTPADSLYYTFAKYPNRLKDTLQIPVTVLGKGSDKDRTIAVDTVNATEFNAVEGVHFKLLPPFIMPAGKTSAVIKVAINRTADLDSIPATFKLQLKENDEFVSGISAKTFLKVKVGYLQKPPTWGEFGGSQWAGYSGNLGTWTKTKYKVVLAALYDPVSDTTVSEFPYLRFGAPSIYIQYLQLVKNYIKINYPGNYSTPVGIGATLKDPDANNALILVGPANY